MTPRKVQAHLETGLTIQQLEFAKDVSENTVEVIGIYFCDLHLCVRACLTKLHAWHVVGWLVLAGGGVEKVWEVLAGK